MFISAIASGVIAYIGWKRRDVRGVGYFSVYAGLIAWWSFFYALEVTAIYPDIHLLFLKIEYLAIPWIPGFVILFALQFGGFEKIITLKTKILVFLIPFASFIAYYTNEFHHLYYLAVHPLVIDGLTIISIEPGIMYVLLTSYIFFSIFLSFLIFIRILLNSPRVFLIQSYIFLFVLIMLMAGYLYYLYMPRIYPDFDITPIILAIADVFVLFGIFRYQFFDLVYFPHRKIFEHLHDGVIVLDTVDRILEMNAVSQKMLKIREVDPIGKKFNLVCSFLAENFGDLSGDVPISQDIKYVLDNSIFHYAVDVYPVFDSLHRLECRLIVIRDITDIIRSNTALSKAGKKLGMLNSITRHDILNQIMIISGYSQILTRKGKDISDLQTPLERIMDATAMIQQLIEFTSMYQDMGVSEPGWFDVRDIAQKAWVTRNPPDTIRLTIDANIVIYADMLIEKVFFNLYDNSIRHGGDVTRISVSCEVGADTARIIYEDDGQGISPGSKENIFKRGFGKNTGYGLFLVREILSITNITIRECGQEHAGVRFEMQIPVDGYRIVDNRKDFGFLLR
jgi:signal transduction histidine kinase